MEENNLNNQQRNSSKVIMILLVLIIVGLLGFIVYDKFIQKDTKLVPETNAGQKDCNCPKCEECEKCENNASQCNCSNASTSYLGEKITSLKKVNITNKNQEFKIGSKTFKVRKNADNVLFINDEEAYSPLYGLDYAPDEAYVTDKFMFFVTLGQYKGTISYAISDKGNLGINNNDCQMDNFKLKNGYIYAEGGAVILDGPEIGWNEGNVIIKLINNTLIVNEAN